MNDKAIEYLEQAKRLQDNPKLPVINKALLLYKLAGHAEGYGVAMLSRDATIDFESGVGSACYDAAREIQAIAEEILGNKKP